MQSISPELYEAAELDGAGPIGRFRSITFPGIRPMLLIVALFELLMAFTSFDLVYALTQGGPGTATTMVSYFAWVGDFPQARFWRGRGAGDHDRAGVAVRHSDARCAPCQRARWWTSSQ